ncbi:hypothetical protein BV898_18340 [Hypsibius exemplaris]|uniref:Uncharacterized protein n=1 Tax=Hypsibius exemplaris TaxID=2072580 RepID=A0A9X6NJU1_HYPEX|nr:hypothetical protein BV898_18340 [Hypsibius exemplaris]
MSSILLLACACALALFAPVANAQLLGGGLGYGGLGGGLLGLGGAGIAAFGRDGLDPASATAVWVADSAMAASVESRSDGQLRLRSRRSAGGQLGLGATDGPLRHFRSSS